MNSSFPCSSCGLCCKSLSNNPLATDLNRGDGVCRHLDEETKLCKIYTERPLVCRVEDFYNTFLTDKYSWDGFVKLNLAICEKLQKT
jgi:Fe-S-cluster containining protein|nr:YkgJ family cysteine cluster protein [Enhydrobacter sp. AX1]